MELDTKTTRQQAIAVLKSGQKRITVASYSGDFGTHFLSTLRALQMEVILFN